VKNGVHLFRVNSRATFQSMHGSLRVDGPHDTRNPATGSTAEIHCLVPETIPAGVAVHRILQQRRPSLPANVIGKLLLQAILIGQLHHGGKNAAMIER